MENNLAKYFAGELDEEEKVEFLSQVVGNTDLKEDFIENHHLMVWIDSLPQKKDKEKALLSLFKLMHKINNK